MPSHSDLVYQAAKWLRKHTQNAIIPNCSIVTTELPSNNDTGEIPDVIGFGHQKSVLLEIKTSRSDFLKDAFKSFRQKPELGMGQLRYYVVPSLDVFRIAKDSTKLPIPEGTISIPFGWGILLAEPGQPITIYHRHSVQFEANTYAERNLILSLLRRANIKDDKFLWEKETFSSLKEVGRSVDSPTSKRLQESYKYNSAKLNRK